MAGEVGQITTVHYTPHYLRSFARLTTVLKDLQGEREKIFQANPFDPRLDTHELKGRLAGLWSYSVDRKNRVLFRFIGNGVVLYYDVGPHDIYQL